jgi:hypothetical protein
VWWWRCMYELEEAGWNWIGGFDLSGSLVL